MQSIVNIILTALITITMQTGAIGIATTTPQQATEDLMKGLEKCDQQVMEKYMDNAYVNFLCDEDNKDLEKINDALFEKFSYEIVQIKEKNDVAVAKLIIKSSDFSGVMPAYNTASYDYVMKNLYEESIGDKKELEKKCMEIYVSEVEKAAASDKMLETTVFVPMIDDGFYGWNIIMTDALMMQILGNLGVPVIK